MEPYGAPITRAELQLDTKGACFLCLQPIPASSNEEDVDKVKASDAPREVCLRSICRNLGISVRAILLPVLGCDCPSDVYNSDLTVMMCGHCGSVTEHLSELLMQLEEQQMRVDYQTQQFYRILEECEDGKRWLEVKTRMTEPEKEESLAEAQIVERLRGETAQKCANAMKQIAGRRQPVVELVRLKEEDIPKVSTPLSPPLPIEDDFDIGSPNDSNVDEEENTNTMPVIHPSEYDTLNDFFNVVSQQYLQKLKSPTKLPYKYKCLTCNKQISAKNYPRDHLFVAHPEIFFVHLKVATINESEFGGCCSHVVKSQVRLAKKVGALASRECPHCGKVCSQGQHLRSHLVVEHYAVLVKKIKEIQTTDNIPTEKPELRADYNRAELSDPSQKLVDNICKKHYKYKQTKQGTRFSCFVCAHNFPATNARDHLVTTHPQIFFKKEKLPELSDDQFNIFCRHAFDLETSQASKAIESKSNQFRCTYCDAQMFNKSQLRYHLLLKHYIMVRERVVQVQQQGNLQELEKSLKLLAKSRGGMKTKFSRWLSETCDNCYTKEEESGNKKMLCRLCGKVTDPNNSGRHVICIHSEILFQKHKLDSITEQQFKICCRYVFEMEIKDAMKKDQQSKVVDECAYCHCKIQHNQHYRFHLAMKHFSTLEQKLKVYQEEQVWKKPEARKLTFKLLSQNMLSHYINPGRMNKDKDPMKDVLQSLYTRQPGESGEDKQQTFYCHPCQTNVKDAKRHLVHVHPERCFPGRKLESVSEPKFQDYCMRALNKVSGKKKSLTKPGTRQVLWLKCGYCQFMGRHSQHLRYHVIMVHYQVVEEALMKLQRKENPVSNKIEEIDPRTGTMKQYFLCTGPEGCGARFPNQHSLNFHRTRACSWRVNYNEIMSSMLANYESSKKNTPGSSESACKNHSRSPTTRVKPATKRKRQKHQSSSSESSLDVDDYCYNDDSLEMEIDEEGDSVLGTMEFEDFGTVIMKQEYITPDMPIVDEEDELETSEHIRVMKMERMVLPDNMQQHGEEAPLNHEHDAGQEDIAEKNDTSLLRTGISSAVHIKTEKL